MTSINTKTWLSLSLGTLCGLAVINGLPAQAGTLVTYTFTSPTGTQTSPQIFSPVPSGPIIPSLTVTGARNGNEAGISFNINATTGLGVAGAPSAGNVGRSATDGIESVELDFPGTLEHTLKSVTFGALSTNTANRDITLTVDGTALPSVKVPGTTTPVTVPFDETGNTFLFTPTGNGDVFRLISADFHVVPEPLTIIGTGVAFGFLPLMKKARLQKNK